MDIKDVKREFEAARAGKKRMETIPEHLRRKVAGLAKTHKTYHITKELRLSSPFVKKCVEEFSTVVDVKVVSRKSSRKTSIPATYAEVISKNGLVVRIMDNDVNRNASLLNVVEAVLKAGG